MEKTYIITGGKHIKDGVTYVKGDKIELTDEQAKGLTNKIVDPSDFGVDVSNDSSEVARLKERIAELELEVQELREAIDDEA